MYICHSPQKGAVLHTYGKKCKATFHGATRRWKAYIQWGVPWFPKGIVMTLLSLPQSHVSQHVLWQPPSEYSVHNRYRLPCQPWQCVSWGGRGGGWLCLDNQNVVGENTGIICVELMSTIWKVTYCLSHHAAFSRSRVNTRTLEELNICLDYVIPCNEAWSIIIVTA